MEFGGSGEDSFVAVVVTKLTGALLFILLLTMVIMALLPKAVDMQVDRPESSRETSALAITTPEALPDAIKGRPYSLALAANGGQGTLTWAVNGQLPDGLTFNPKTARIEGTPRSGTPEPLALTVHVTDGVKRDSRTVRLVVFQSDEPLSTPSRWKPGIPPIPWRAWLEQGVGFLLLWMIHLVGMNAVAALERRTFALHADDPDPEQARGAARARFAIYRLTVRLASLTATAALAVWLWRQHA
jgi:hypothetical protein